MYIFQLGWLAVDSMAKEWTREKCYLQAKDSFYTKRNGFIVGEQEKDLRQATSIHSYDTAEGCGTLAFRLCNAELNLLLACSEDKILPFLLSLRIWQS